MGRSGGLRTFIFRGRSHPAYRHHAPPEALRLPVEFLAVFAALVITGIISARMSGAPMVPVTLRVVAGGILAMIITFGIGKLFGGAAL